MKFKIKAIGTKAQLKKKLARRHAKKAKLALMKKVTSNVVKSIKKSKVRKEKPVVEKEVKKQTLDISASMIDQALAALLKLNEERKEKSKMLLLKDDNLVFLQVNILKIPEIGQPSRKYLKLHHKLWADDAEICLFVENHKLNDRVARTPDEKIEVSVEFYEKFLKLQKIEGITAIIPVHQLRTEYDSYELKRKLVDKFDLFLCQSTLLEEDKFMDNIGVAFNRKNKLPIVVKFPKNFQHPDPKFKQRVHDALHSTWFQLRPHANSYSVKIGSLNQTPEELRENLMFIMSQLAGEEVIPGGVTNIKSLLLKTARSSAVPLYMSLASSNSVPLPTVRSHLPKATAVTGNLTTQIGKKVTVLRSGEIFVTRDEEFKPPPDWSDEEIFGGEESGSDEDEEVDVHVQRGGQKRKQSKLADEGESGESESSDDDQQAEAAEDKYLQQWGEGNQDNVSPVKARKKAKNKGLKKQVDSSTKGKKKTKDESRSKKSSGK